MPLTSGTRLGPYEILSPIGKGGMGEVYRAHDTKLDRDVAIKVLPEEFALDDERLARFEREAKLLASLNHPNIASIYGFESNALVLELVEGPTLAERIEEGPISVEETIAIAQQIAEALEAGHEAGVIHRDLKPANVKLREDGTVKVLDYGLAKAFVGEGAEPTDSGLSQSPTMTRQGTQIGMILGTAAYMSPEQAKGKRVDKRTDVWAFGALVYEMLTGERAFAGEDVSETLAAVLRADPNWEALPSDLPPPLHTYLKHCLEKDRKRRIRDMGDVHLAFSGAFETATASAEQPGSALALWQRPVPLALAGMSLFLVGGLTLGGSLRAPPVPSNSVTRLPFIAPEGDSILAVEGMALSPDGTTLVYPAVRDGVYQLFVRRRDALDVQPLRGTEGASHPFFSPDGAWVGFFANGALEKVALAGGAPLKLCAVGIRYGATWGPDDTIVFASSLAPGLMQVSASGGEPRALTQPEAEYVAHRWPSFVPGGEAVIYTVRRPGGLDTFELSVVSLKTGAEQSLVRGTDGEVVASGQLVFGREASLWAVSFDRERLEVSGEPVPVVEGVRVNSGGWALYASADDGTLVYSPSHGGDAKGLTWVDRVSREETPVTTPDGYVFHPDLSPDGTRVALESSHDFFDVWILDFSADAETRLTFDDSTDRYAKWTPDGERIIFSSTRSGVAGLFWRAADGTGTAESLGESEWPRYPMDVSPDGRVVIVQEIVEGDSNLITVSLVGTPVSKDLLVTPYRERNAVVSPDGRWLAYQSDASGADEVYVRSFATADSAQHQISTDGGTEPLWAPDGSELFYRDRSRLRAVPIRISPTFARGEPSVAIQSGVLETSLFGGRSYDVDPSGERFLAITTARWTGDRSLTFVLNWDTELERLIPTK